MYYNFRFLKFCILATYNTIVFRRQTLASQVPQQHQWLEKPNCALTGADYIGAIKLRGNLMKVPLRATRGCVAAISTSDACGGLDRSGTSYRCVRERMLPVWRDTIKLLRL